MKYLNGKDYTKWGAKRVHKNRKVKDIYKKIVHHEKDMIKTLKRAKVENVRNKNLIYGYQENEDEENSCN